MRDFEHKTTDDCIHIRHDADHIRLAAEPFFIGGTPYLPCQEAYVGSFGDCPDAGFIIISMRHGPGGIALQFTPAGAIGFADAIIRAADSADKLLAADTAARLSTLTGKPVAVPDPHHPNHREQELNRRIRAAREQYPDDPAYTEDYPGDWPDAPHPAPLPPPDDIDDWRERLANRIALVAVAGVFLLGLGAWLAQ